MIPWATSCPPYACPHMQGLLLTAQPIVAGIVSVVVLLLPILAIQLF